MPSAQSQSIRTSARDTGHHPLDCPSTVTPKITLVIDLLPFFRQFFTHPPGPPALRSQAASCHLVSLSASPPASLVLRPALPVPPPGPPYFTVIPTWAPESISTPGSFSCVLPLPSTICVVFQDCHIPSWVLSQACPQQGSRRTTHRAGLQHDLCRQTLARF